MKGITGSITDTIDEYRKSKHRLMCRIHELNRKIGRNKSGGEIKELAERRRKLYAMTYDLDLALRLMGEYALETEQNIDDERKELSYAG
jgi:hypothetical protein